MSFQSSLLLNATNLQAISNARKESTDAYGVTPMMLDPDTEPIIMIDSDLRKIIVPKELYNIGVAGDHLAETIYFQVPRYFDGNDLSEHKCIIRFINAGKEYGESETCNLEIFDDYIKFGWSIDNNATRYAGVLKFTVQFDTIIHNGIEYQWQTTPAELNILAGLNIEQTISDKDDVLFRSLVKQIQALQDFVLKLDNLPTDVEYLQNKILNIETELKNLKNNVVYVLDE